ncbi:MAG: GDP-mannose 4,6-dehydratase [Clostridia bacterium]|nr:GDP-mannose 4,6-dehydratase [Clostridia bacterium]
MLRGETTVRALVTGVTGQDGSYLAEFLLDKGYEVYGMVRRSSVENFNRIEHIRDKLKFVQADLLDQLSIIDAIKESRPDEIYNLGAMSFIPISWKQPVLTGEFTGLGVTRMLEAARHMNKNVKFYQASSSEMFGKAREIPQNEKTPFYPRSPYGVAKVYGHYMTVNYRESYDMFACSGILFNHESPRRGLEFVTKKVTYGAAKIKLGLADSLYLGNLDAKRDWGYAEDYIEAMWLMLQQNTPEDYVISTGESHSVKEWVETSFRCLDLDWRKYVKIDKRFIRPVDVDLLVGDSSKAEKKLGWKTKVSFNELVKIMVEYDYNYLKKQM